MTTKDTLTLLLEVEAALRIKYSGGIYEQSKNLTLMQVLIENDVDPQRVSRDSLLYCFAETLLNMKQALPTIQELIRRASVGVDEACLSSMCCIKQPTNKED